MVFATWDAVRERPSRYSSTGDGSGLTHEERFQGLPRGGACVHGFFFGGATGKHIGEDAARRRIHGGTGKSRRTALCLEVFRMSRRQSVRDGDGAGPGRRELQK